MFLVLPAISESTSLSFALWFSSMYAKRTLTYTFTHIHGYTNTFTHIHTHSHRYIHT